MRRDTRTIMAKYNVWPVAKKRGLAGRMVVEHGQFSECIRWQVAK
jgi:hypothetical protein